MYWLPLESVIDGNVPEVSKGYSRKVGPLQIQKKRANSESYCNTQFTSLENTIDWSTSGSSLHARLWKKTQWRSLCGNLGMFLMETDPAVVKRLQHVITVLSQPHLVSNLVWQRLSLFFCVCVAEYFSFILSFFHAEPEDILAFLLTCTSYSSIFNSISWWRKSLFSL